MTLIQGESAATARSVRRHATAANLDILGIGLGPANLSLAIAIEEYNQSSPTQPIRAHFFEAQPRFGWHDGMLLPNTTMQVSFLKDLATLRAPRSSYTFVNYLQQRGRLIDFINLKTFFPTRKEFHDYLCWAADRLTVPVTYGTAAAHIDAAPGGLRITCADTSTRVEQIVPAAHVVIGTGISPVLPPGVVAGPRVFHNHRLLTHLAHVPGMSHRRFLVVGAGQSAAEVMAFLLDRHPDAEVHGSIRRFGYLPADDTPYANRVFDPAAVDDFYDAPPDVKQTLLQDHRLTNYSAVDADLIEDLYRREYAEQVSGGRRLFLHRLTEIADIRESRDGVNVWLRDRSSGQTQELCVDAVVLATGFRPSGVRELLGPSVMDHCAFDGEDPVVERDYSLRMSGSGGRVYLNGGVEHSHGLSSSLLSNQAVRAGEILQSISGRLARTASS